jgi:DNA mismatch repair protein MSH5
MSLGRERSPQARTVFLVTLAAVFKELISWSLALRSCRLRNLPISSALNYLLSAASTALDGAGLLCGVLKHFLQRGINCPKVLVATHFHDLFREDLLDPDISPISFRHMQVMFTSSNGTVLDSHMDTSELDEVSQNRHCLGERKVGAGEKITYLYR